MRATLSNLVLLDGTLRVARHWAEVHVVRHRQPIESSDAWIAATALAHGIELITHNPADFRGIPGLVVVTEHP